MNWVERLKQATEKSMQTRLYWVARGCCVESYRKKCVAMGLVPAEVVPMSEEDKAHFRFEPIVCKSTRIEKVKKKEEPVDKAELEKEMQRVCREHTKMKLLADIASDMQVSVLMRTDPYEYINDLIKLLNGFNRHNIKVKSCGQLEFNFG